jgi:hypothetical protein
MHFAEHGNKIRCHANTSVRLHLVKLQGLDLKDRLPADILAAFTEDRRMPKIRGHCLTFHLTV